MPLPKDVVSFFVKEFRKKYWKYMKVKAKNILKDNKKTKAVINQAWEKSIDNKEGVLAEILDSFQVTLLMMRDTITGKYEELSKSSMILIMAGLIYFVMPVDMVLDLIPGGLIDDVVILSFLINHIQKKLSDYKVWRKTYHVIEYYDRHALEYIHDTINQDLHSIYTKFIRYLPTNASILDLACGSGRDTKWFMMQKFNVIATEGSKVMADQASFYLKRDVLVQEFTQMNFQKRFDGVWAYASLIHLDKDNFIQVVKKIHKALRTQGVFYASFPYGQAMIEQEGIPIYLHNEETIKEVFSNSLYWDIIDIWHEEIDHQPWLHFILKKKYFL